MYRIHLPAFLVFISSLASAQVDKEFWFVGPDIAQSHGDRPIMWRISTMNDTAHITLRMPAGLWFTPITQTIPPNSNFTINLTPWIDSIENKPANTVLNRGILMTSDKLVTSYYEIKHNNNPGIFSLKGKNALGTDFYIVSQNDYYNQVGQESFDIVATEDNTTVTIIPSDTIIGHKAGIPFNVTLNKGQTFTARAVYTTASRTLCGSHVTSTKPIAISWQDDSIYQGGAYDVICDQIIPNTILGTDYIAIRGWANTNERVYVCGTVNNTEIRLNGNPIPVATIQAGQLYKYQLPAGDNTVFLEATQPVHVLHLSGFGNEFGGSILPQDSCTGSTQVGFYRSSSSTFSLLVLTRNGNQGSFLLDGSAALLTAADFSIVNGTANAWVYARKQFNTSQIDTGAHLIVNTMGKFHLGILNNLGASSEYGYFSDFSSLYLGADASMCPTDSMVLDGGAGMTTYEWKQLVSGVWTLVGTTRYYTVHDSGFFACMVNGNFCTLMDTIHISIYPNATVNLGPDTSICQGATITFNPGTFVSYLWSTGSTSQQLTTGTPGTYWIRVVNNNDCVARDTVILSLDSLPQANHPITGEDTVCQGQNGVPYAVDSLHFAASYTWTLPPGASGASSTNSISLNFSGTAASGQIKVRGHNDCGDGPDVLMDITVKSLPGTPGAISGPDTVCQGQTGVAFSVDPAPFATGYSWTLPPGGTVVSGGGTNTIVAGFALNAVSGTVSVLGTNDCGTGPASSRSLHVNLFPTPAGTITGITPVCQGAQNIAYSVAPVPGADFYLWTLPPGAVILSGDSTTAIMAGFDSTALSGQVTVRGCSESCGNGVPSALQVTVNPLPAPAGAISGDATVCQSEAGVVYSIPPIAYATGYVWTVPTGASIVSGSGTRQITVNYSSSAQTGIVSVWGTNSTCGSGRHSSLPVTVDPLPAAAGNITGPTPVCQNQSGVVYSVPPVTFATSYIWTYSGSGASILNNGASATVNFSPAATGGSLTVAGQNACGPGLSSPGFAIQVNPRPDVTLQICEVVTSRNAQPFPLRGGIPLGGSYTGTGVSGGVFTPSAVPLFMDSVTITYTYTNFYTCSYSATQKIAVRSAPVLTCGDTLTDIRDNRKYPTVALGSQCWMAANLNYGQQIPASTLQRDNCVAEKYCYNDSPALCAMGSVLYQWDEVMQYTDLPGVEGLCPPGWHIPTENDWNTLFTFYISNGFAGSPLKSSGYSGFNAFLSGIRFHTSIWKYPINDPVLRSILFWSSAKHGTIKAWAHGMNEVAADIEYTPSVSFYPALRSNAFAVRCMRD